MIDIFCITDTKTRKVVIDGFENKIAAKKERDFRNKETDSINRFVVSRGKDHIGGSSTPDGRYY